MKRNLTELVFILDRSGSMGGLEQDTIGGFNAMLTRQKEQEGEANVTTILFDHEVQLLHDRFPLKAVAPLTEKDYYVRGCTALLDAIGYGVEKMKGVLHRPEKSDILNPENISNFLGKGENGMEHLYEKALESAEYIKTHTKKRPKIAVVLGSGLGKLTADFTDTEELSYKDIPNFPVSTVAGHKGALLAGKLGDTEVYAMEGRFHFYEGYSMKEVCYPFYVFKLLGVEKVVLTNACGGINREFAPGTLMLITDFINMMGTNPLIGPNDERFGPRFPDMTEPYSLELRNLAKQTADELGIAYKEGVYMGFMGPCYETAAEIRAFAEMGADAVGMSTVPETMVCNYMGMKVLAVSCITNMATGIQTVKHSHARVLEIANQAGDTLCRWLGAVIQRME